MDNNHVIALFPEYLDGILEASQQKKVDEHIKGCPSCAKELKEFKIIFEIIKDDKVDVPSERMRATFHRQLELEKQSQPEVVALDTPQPIRTNTWVVNLMKIAASILLLIGTFLLGRYQQREKSNIEMIALENETLEMKQMAMLSLMENKSASRRIQGVNYIDKFEKPDEAIIKALVDRMRTDGNVNVRLTAVQALEKFTISNTVRDALIEALETEKTPSVQIVIIKTLIRIQEKKAMAPMQKLLEKEDTRPFIKEQIKLLLPTIS